MAAPVIVDYGKTEKVAPAKLNTDTKKEKALETLSRSKIKTEEQQTIKSTISSLVNTFGVTEEKASNLVSKMPISNLKEMGTIIENATKSFDLNKVKTAVVKSVDATLKTFKTMKEQAIGTMNAIAEFKNIFDIALGKDVDLDKKQREQEMEAQREQERQRQLKMAPKEIEKISKFINNAVKGDKNLQESFATIQNRWNSQIKDSTKILACLAESKTLEQCTKQFLSKDLSKEAYESILKDVALGKNINQVVENVVKKERLETSKNNIDSVKAQKLTEEQQQLLATTKEKLLEKGISQERTTQIVKDIEDTLKNPGKINQGEYATCVACAAINNAIYKGKGDTLIKLFNEQLDTSTSLVDSLKGEYGKSAFESKNPKMFGGALQAALMSSVSEGGVFTNNGEVQVTGADGKTCLISGLTDKQIANLHKKLNLGVDSKVIYADTLQGNPPSEETFKGNIKNLLAENPAGLNVKLRWGEGVHTFHMVNIVGIDDKGNIIMKNSQDPVFADRKYDTNGYEKMSADEVMARLKFAIVENNAGLEFTNGSEIKEDFIIGQDNYASTNPEQLERVSKMTEEELDELYKKNLEGAPEPEGAVTYCQTVGEIEREKARTRNETSKGSNSK